MSKINILQINKLYSPWIGGIESIVKDVAEAMKKKADMTVLVCSPKGKGCVESVDGVKVVRAGSFGMKFSMPISFSFPFLVRKYSRSADVIILHDPFPLGDLAVLLSGFHGKLIVWWHSDIVKQKRLRKLLNPIIERLLRRADRILTTSEQYIDGSSYLSRYRQKCAIIPYGIDIEKYDSIVRMPILTEQLNKKENVKLLFVGRLVYYKGIGFLLKAMETVNGAELFIVGKGPDEKALKTYVEVHGLSDRVHFISPLPEDQLKAAFADCDIFVFPSVAKSEAFGIVQLEAMVYGKPVINTRLGTSVEYVSLDGITGITVEPEDSKALAAAITKLTVDSELRRKLGENAARRVCEKFSLKENYGNVLNRISSIVKEK